MKNPFKINREKFNLKNIRAKLLSWWLRRSKILFVIYFLAMLGIAGYYWYKSVYTFSWSEEKKAQYLSAQAQQVNLKEGEFKKTIEEIEAKKNYFNNEYRTIKDIFEPY